MKKDSVIKHGWPPHANPSQICLNTLRTRRNRRHFADDIFKCILLNETVLISTKISLKFIPKGLINNIPALVQIMAWRRPGDKPLSEPMMIISLTHICVTRPQWVKRKFCKISFAHSIHFGQQILLKFYTELNIMNAVFSAKWHKDLLYQKAMQKPDFQFTIDFKMACLTLKLLLWTEFYKSLF